MVVLMGKRTQETNYRFVEWEISCAMQQKLPIYVMKRRDQHHRWADDSEVRDFLERVDSKYQQRYGRLRLWPPNNQGFKGWDPNAWVYPQMCRFLDKSAPR